MSGRATLDALLCAAGIGERPERQPGEHTVAELAARAGIKQSAMRDRLNASCLAGKLQRRQCVVPGVRGVAWCYRVG